MDLLGPGIGVVTAAVPVPVPLERESHSHAISIHNARLTHSLRLDLQVLAGHRSVTGWSQQVRLGVTRAHRRSSLSIGTSWPKIASARFRLDALFESKAAALWRTCTRAYVSSPPARVPVETNSITNSPAVHPEGVNIART
jgi:hypothetical protein